MILFSTRMSSSGRSRSRSALGVRGEYALAGPRGAVRTPAVWDLGPAAPRRDGAHERVVVCRRASALCPHKLFMFLPKASTNLSVAEALFDLSGRSVEDMRQVSRTP